MRLLGRGCWTVSVAILAIEVKAYDSVVGSCSDAALIGVFGEMCANGTEDGEGREARNS